MLDSDVLFNILKIAGLFIGLSFIVFWVGLVWWVSQDVLTRTSDKIIVAAAVAMTAILGPVGVMFYLIIRPRQTMKESYGEMMEHEMMLRAAATTICPMCEHMTQEDFVNCPYCGTVLKKQCAGCQKLVDMDWSYCPYCGHVAAKPPTQTLVKPVTTLEPATIQELKDSQEVAQIKSSSIEQARLDQVQKATFSTSIGFSSQHKERITNAGQSALSLFKQTLGSSSRPVSTNLEPQPSIESTQQPDEIKIDPTEIKNATDESNAPTKTDLVKKRTVKGRASRRAKK